MQADRAEFCGASAGVSENHFPKFSQVSCKKKTCQATFSRSNLSAPGAPLPCPPTPSPPCPWSPPSLTCLVLPWLCWRGEEGPAESPACAPVTFVSYAHEHCLSDERSPLPCPTSCVPICCSAVRVWRSQGVLRKAKISIVCPFSCLVFGAEF